jgi:ArsR family transcriptional regulator
MEERLFQMKADFLKALAHPTRIRILEHLRAEERCVCRFIEDLDMEQSNVSQHLAVLKKQELVSSRKEGTNVIYKVDHPEVYAILDMINEVLYTQVNSTMKLLKTQKILK